MSVTAAGAVKRLPVDGDVIATEGRMLPVTESSRTVTLSNTAAAICEAS